MAKHELPALPYEFGALEPYIDAQTMEIHHDKHHAAYVNNLNGALDKHPSLFDHSLEDVLRDLASVPEEIRTAVRNTGGGHANHSFFWPLLSGSGGGEPVGDLASAMTAEFGTFDAFKELFSTAAATPTAGQASGSLPWMARAAKNTGRKPSTTTCTVAARTM